MNKKRVILLSLVLGFFLLNGLTASAVEQTNYDYDEKAMTFQLIENDSTSSDGNNKNQITTNKQTDLPGSSTNQTKAYPKTGEVKLLMLSFSGTLLAGMALLIILIKRRQQDEMQKK